MLRTVTATTNTTRQFGVGLASCALQSCCACFQRSDGLLASLAQKPLWYFGDTVSDFREASASRAALLVHAVARTARTAPKNKRLASTETKRLNARPRERMPWRIAEADDTVAITSERTST